MYTCFPKDAKKESNKFGGTIQSDSISPCLYSAFRFVSIAVVGSTGTSLRLPQVDAMDLAAKNKQPELQRIWKNKQAKNTNQQIQQIWQI